MHVHITLLVSKSPSFCYQTVTNISGCVCNKYQKQTSVNVICHPTLLVFSWSLKALLQTSELKFKNTRYVILNLKNISSSSLKMQLPNSVGKINSHKFIQHIFLIYCNDRLSLHSNTSEKVM